MKTAMILAAGRGQRMRALTERLPKPLLQVDGKPLLQRQIERLHSLGCERVIVNCAHMGEQIKDFLGSGRWLGVVVKYSDEGSFPVGTAAGVRRALPLLGEQPFWLVSSDSLCDYPKIPAPAGDDLANVLLVQNPAHNSQGDFYLCKDRLVPAGGTRLTYSGIGAYKPEFFQAEASGLAELLAAAVAANRVGASLHTGYWIDVGTEERLAQANQLIQTESACT